MTREAVFAELYYYLPLIVHDSKGLWEKPGMTNKELLKLWDEAVNDLKDAMSYRSSPIHGLWPLYRMSAYKWSALTGLSEPAQVAHGY